MQLTNLVGGLFLAIFGIVSIVFNRTWGERAADFHRDFAYFGGAKLPVWAYRGMYIVSGLVFEMFGTWLVVITLRGIPWQ